MQDGYNERTAERGLQMVENHGLMKLAELIDANQFDEAGKLVDLLRAVSII